MVAIEDADNFVQKREVGNKQMSALLNLADGVFQSKRKIVISTNLSNINSIDEALLRPGRTYRTIQFGKLTIDQANYAHEKIGLPSLAIEDFKVDKVTLAQALNYERSNNIHSALKRVSGFGPN